jgi:predicted secreted protein
MAVAGHKLKVTCATGASATYSDMDGVREFSLSDSDDLLDTTDFLEANSDRVRSRIAGLRDATLSLSGDLEITDAGFQKARAAKRAGDPAVFQVWFNTGTSSVGFALVTRVESIEYSGGVEGKLEVSINASVDGTIIDPIP